MTTGQGNAVQLSRWPLSRVPCAGWRLSPRAQVRNHWTLASCGPRPST